jgi:glutamate-ammonia-ligase adenylyltransferase
MRGGIIDIEFIVQYLILAHARQLPAFTGNTGNIALLAVAAEAGLVSHELAEQGRGAYRYYRKLQHAARLNESSKVEVNDTLRQHYRQTQALWLQVLGRQPVLTGFFTSDGSQRQHWRYNRLLTKHNDGELQDVDGRS